MVWLVIIVVVAVVVGPIMMLKPTAMQKNSAQNRLLAKKLGILLKMTKLDAPHWLPNAPKMCMQYYLMRMPQEEVQGVTNKRESLEFWQIEPQKWVDIWRNSCSENMQEQLKHLPYFVYKVVVDKQIVALYLSDGNADCTKEFIAQIFEFLQKYT